MSSLEKEYELHGYPTTIADVEHTLSEYKDSMKTDPGEITLARSSYSALLNSCTNTRVYMLPPDKNYVPHILTSYGVVAVYPSDRVSHNKIKIRPRMNIDEEFEKIVLK